jgi:glutathione-regulated potassium-efflux system ancillary protein KefG
MSDPSSKILVLFAHPAIQKSRVNRILREAARSLSGVTVHDLYEAYPHFGIDVPREQSLLTSHDILVFQHPLFWYSTPAILKEWQDRVLEHGWAYGREGTALRGKKMMNVITTGGPEEAYRAGGRNRFTIRQFLAPLEQTARLCGMDYLPPFVAHGAHRITEEESEAHATDLRRILASLRDGTVDLTAAGELGRINADLDAVLKG